jgi:hypothetical protein
VALGVAGFIIGKLILELSLVNTLILMILTLILLYPFLLRFSRNIWINFFVDYEKD